MGIPLSPRPARVIDLESMRQRQLARRRLVRLAPELDGLEMVYRLDAPPDTLYGMPILAWGMRENGDIVGLVPWMESLTPCEQLDDPDHGHFVGYRDPETEELFDQPPEHKEMELAHAAASVEGVTGRPVDAVSLLVELLAAVARRYAHVESGAMTALLARWESFAPSSRGAAVEWMSGQTRHQGVTAGIDEEGALLVQVGSRLERLTGGAVRHVRSTGR